MHLAIFIVNQNGSLVYHKVSTISNLSVDHLGWHEILNKWHDSFGLNIPLHACDIFSDHPEFPGDPHELRQGGFSKRDDYGRHQWNCHRYFQAGLLPIVHRREIHLDIRALAQGLRSCIKNRVRCLCRLCEQEPLPRGWDAHQKWPIRAEYH